MDGLKRHTSAGKKPTAKHITSLLLPSSLAGLAVKHLLGAITALHTFTN